jgi:phosphoglycolate phosphatase-like HAD superfamily hydrolase
VRAATVLWDIDGTLVNSGGVAARAFLDAVAAVTGVRPPSGRRDYGGRLDPEIAAMLLAAVGAAADRTSEVLAVLERLVAARLGELRAQTTAYPGVDALLAYLAGAGLRQTVVTGNVAAVARYKLEAARLIPPVEPELGGYGDSGPDRAAVARVALDRLAAARHRRRPRRDRRVGRLLLRLRVQPGLPAGAGAGTGAVPPGRPRTAVPGGAG